MSLPEIVTFFFQLNNGFPYLHRPKDYVTLVEEEGIFHCQLKELWIPGLSATLLLLISKLPDLSILSSEDSLSKKGAECVTHR